MDARKQQKDWSFLANIVGLVAGKKCNGAGYYKPANNHPAYAGRSPLTFDRGAINDTQYCAEVIHITHLDSLWPVLPETSAAVAKLKE